MPRLIALLPLTCACFDTTKERLKRQVHPRLHILQDLGMNRFQGWLIGFPLRQKLIGVIQAQRLFLLLVGVLAGRQCIVIDPTAKLKHSFKACSLGARWEKSVLVGQSHRCIITFLRGLASCVNPFPLELYPACTQRVPAGCALTSP